MDELTPEMLVRMDVVGRTFFERYAGGEHQSMIGIKARLAASGDIVNLGMRPKARGMALMDALRELEGIGLVQSVEVELTHGKEMLFVSVPNIRMWMQLREEATTAANN